MSYTTHAGRLWTWSLELHVVDHCNLRCEHCCTLSPSLDPRFARPSQVSADLKALAPALRPSVVKLTGGEPLLHPRLVAIADAIRDSRIAPALSMTTNGHLFARAPDALLDRLDRVTLSRYESAPLSAPSLARIQARCREHAIRLTVKAIRRFQTLDRPSAAPPADTEETFRTCWLRSRCHLVHQGRFYTCTRPPHLASHLQHPELGQADGLPLDPPPSAATLRAYLSRSEPLLSCRHCRGGQGAWHPHRQQRGPKPSERG